MSAIDMTLINKNLIKDVLLERLGQNVDIYVSKSIIDFSGNETDRQFVYLATEKAYITSRKESHTLDKKGLYFTGDAIGYFPFDSTIQDEYRIKQVTDAGTSLEVIVWWNILGINTSQAEGEAKYKRADLKKVTGDVGYA